MTSPHHSNPVSQADAFGELYDAHGYIARHLAEALVLFAAVDHGLAPGDHANALQTIHDHVVKAYEAAAIERERWAP